LIWQVPSLRRAEMRAAAISVADKLGFSWFQNKSLAEASFN
jgi:hypothetical protein